MLAACERSFGVYQELGPGEIAHRSRLRSALDAMWGMTSFDPVEFRDEPVESFEAHLVMLVEIVFDYAQGFCTSGGASIYDAFDGVLDIADAIDGSLDGPAITGQWAGDVFLRDASSCTSIEVCRQLEGAFSASFVRNREALVHLLRERSARQALSCGLLVNQD